MRFKDGTSKDYAVPAFDHITTLHPLYGVAYVEGESFRIYNPFNYSASPIKFNKWMSLRILEIDGKQYTAEAVLRELADKEGAHTEDDPALLGIDYPGLATDNSALHRACDWVRFSNLSYLQIFSIYMGLYLVNRTKPTLHLLPVAHDNTVQYMCDTINRSPQDLNAEGLKLTISNRLALMFGEDNELMDNYSAGKFTTFKTPGSPRAKHEAPI